MSRCRGGDSELVQLSSGMSTLRRHPQHPQVFDQKMSTTGPRSSHYVLQYDDDDPSITSDTDHALINQHVNPYQEFPSLRGGFSQQPEQLRQENNIKVQGEGDACAYYFWAIAFSIFVLAILNSFVLIAILTVLEIGPGGLNSVEFLPEYGSIKLLKDIWASDISISGVISGFADEPLIVKAENGDVLLQIIDDTNVKFRKNPEMRISKSEVVFNNVESFMIVDPDTGKVIFDANNPVFNLNDDNFETLSVSEIETNRVASPIGKDLLIQSDAGLSLVGTEGIAIESKSVTLEAAENITIDSSSILMSGSIAIDPLALPLGGGGYPGEKPHFKICICHPSGKLFVIPATTSIGRNYCNANFHRGESHPCDEDD